MLSDTNAFPRTIDSMHLPLRAHRMAVLASSLRYAIVGYAPPSSIARSLTVCRPSLQASQCCGDDEYWRAKIVDRLPSRWCEDQAVLRHYDNMHAWRPSDPHGNCGCSAPIIPPLTNDCEPTTSEEGGAKKKYCDWPALCARSQRSDNGSDCGGGQKRYYSQTSKPPQLPGDRPELKGVKVAEKKVKQPKVKIRKPSPPQPLVQPLSKSVQQDSPKSTPVKTASPTTCPAKPSPPPAKPSPTPVKPTAQAITKPAEVKADTLQRVTTCFLGPFCKLFKGLKGNSNSTEIKAKPANPPAAAAMPSKTTINSKPGNPGNPGNPSKTSLNAAKPGSASNTVVPAAAMAKGKGDSKTSGGGGGSTCKTEYKQPAQCKKDSYEKKKKPSTCKTKKPTCPPKKKSECPPKKPAYPPKKKKTECPPKKTERPPKKPKCPPKEKTQSPPKKPKGPPKKKKTECPPKKPTCPPPKKKDPCEKKKKKCDAGPIPLEHVTAPHKMNRKGVPQRCATAGGEPNIHEDKIDVVNLNPDDTVKNKIFSSDFLHQTESKMKTGIKNRAFCMKKQQADCDDEGNKPEPKCKCCAHTSQTMRTMVMPITNQSIIRFLSGTSLTRQSGCLKDEDDEEEMDQACKDKIAQEEAERSRARLEQLAGIDVFKDTPQALSCDLEYRNKVQKYYGDKYKNCLFFAYHNFTYYDIIAHLMHVGTPPAPKPQEDDGDCATETEQKAKNDDFDKNDDE